MAVMVAVPCVSAAAVYGLFARPSADEPQRGHGGDQRERRQPPARPGGSRPGSGRRRAGPGSGARAGWPASRCRSARSRCSGRSGRRGSPVSPSGASSGTSSSVADRFVSRLASSVASSAMHQQAGVRRRRSAAASATRSPSEPVREGGDDHAEASTNTANAGCAACDRPADVDQPAAPRPDRRGPPRSAPRDPARVDPERREHREADQHQPTTTSGRRQRRGRGGSSGAVRVGAARGRARMQHAQHDVLHDQHDRQHRRHPQREPGEGEVEVRHRQQVGEVGDRAAAARRSWPSAGRRGCPAGAGTPSATRGRDDHRGEQHDGGVEAEHGGDRRGERGRRR